MTERLRPLSINGWTIYVHPLFLAQVEALIKQVEKLKKKDPRGYKKKNPTKRLAAIRKLVFQQVPADPEDPAYRQGDALGEEHKHWFRAKFFQQYRLFFRFDKASKVIIFAWVNDEHSKRAYGSKTDAYKVFKGMLDRGNPPDDWDHLLKVVKDASLEFPSGDALRVRKGSSESK